MDDLYGKKVVKLFETADGRLHLLDWSRGQLYPNIQIDDRATFAHDVSFVQSGDVPVEMAPENVRAADADPYLDQPGTQLVVMFTTHGLIRQMATPQHAATRRYIGLDQ